MGDNRFSYSFSTIDLFLKCPLAFKLHKIDKFEQDDSYALILGRLFHEIAAEYVGDLVRNQRQTDIEKLDEILESKQGQCSFEIFDDLKKVVHEFTESHVLNFDYQKDFRIEQRLAFDSDWHLLDDYFDREAFFRGVVDLSHWENDLLVITDYKTNRFVEAQSEVENNFQLDIYAYLMKLIYPEVERVLVRLDYVRFSTYRKKEIDLDSINNVPQKIMRYVEQIELADKFEPRISSYCDFCIYASHCPKFKALLKKDTNFVLNSSEDAWKLAEQLRLVEAFKKHATAKLKQWVDQNRPIVIGDECLNYHEMANEFFDDPVEVVRQMHAIGLNKEQIWQAITLTPTNVKRVLKKNRLKDEWESIFEPMMTREKRSRFQFKKE